MDEDVGVVHGTLVLVTHFLPGDPSVFRSPSAGSVGYAAPTSGSSLAAEGPPGAGGLGASTRATNTFGFEREMSNPMRPYAPRREAASQLLPILTAIRGLIDAPVGALLR